jgi:nicotinamidase/pyrazinamidase
MAHDPNRPTPWPGDALLVVDVQNDFLPGGALGVPDGDAVVPVLNRYLARFATAGLPIFATRDWHPADGLELPDAVSRIAKAIGTEKDSYSGFEDTELAAELRAAGVSRLLIGGLATDYCVLNTVLDALREGFEVLLLADAIRAVEVQPGDGDAAIARMTAAGAVPILLEDLG